MAYKDLASAEPYYDDFNKNLNFLSILFKPGRAVQGRELTQAQTILQNQVAQLAGHVFENNSLVYGGEIDFNLKKPAAKIQLDYYESGGAATGTIIQPASLIGNKYQNAAGTSEFTITHALIVNSELFIYYSYTGVNAITDEKLEAVVGTNLDLKLIGDPFNATSVQCKPGIIYKDGYFVTIIQQEKIIANTDTGRISAGYRFEEDIVTEDDPYYGATLRDPANGSYNRNAPGAARYRITPVLDGFEKDPDDVNKVKIWSIQDGSEIVDGRRVQVDDFFQKYRQIVLVKNGNIIKDNTQPIYGDILKMIARRTHDESGDYTIEDFKIIAKDGVAYPDNYKLIVSSGKAYVKGFEQEKLNKTILRPTKAREYNTIDSGRATSKGTYYVVLDQEATAQEMVRSTGSTGYPAFENFTLVNFYDANDTVIGSGKLLTFTRQSSDYRAYFAEIKDLVPNIRIASYFKTDAGTMKFYLRQGEEGPSISGSRAPLVYPIEGTIFTKNVGFVTYDTHMEVEVNSNGSGEALVVRTPGEIDFYDDNNGGLIMVQDTATGTQIDIDTLTASGGSSNTITGLASSRTYRMILKAEIVDAQQRTKSLTTVTDEIQDVSADGNEITLDQEDVYEIVSIKEVGAGKDYTFTDKELNRITLDNGGRDFWYQNGKISGLSLVGLKRNGSARQFKITYKYFTHSALTETSQFFTVNSYFTDFSDNLGDIKSYKSANKVSYKLIDCIDFRPKLSDLAVGNANIVNPFGRMAFSYETYMPRIDRVYISSEGKIGWVEGVPSAQNKPEIPPELDESMTLGTVYVPAYTPTPFNIKIQENDNRRYTMRDIGKLEDRIENLEVYTSLTALERSAADLNITDSNGFDRFKNGIFVDPFQNHLIGNVFDEQYRCVTFPGGGMTCPFEAVALEFDKDITPDEEVAIFPELITCQIESISPLAENLTASTCVNVNPYLYAEWEGTVRINPSVDTWTEVRYDPDEVRQGLILANQASGRGGFNNGPGGVNATGAERQQTIAELGSDWQDWGQWMGLDKNTWRDIAFQNFRDPLNQTTNINQGTTNITSILSGGNNGNSNFAYTSVTTDRLVGNENAVYARPITVEYFIEGMRPQTPLVATLGDTDLVLSNDQTDGNGNAQGTFEIPEFTVPTGQTLLKVVDTSQNSTAQTTFTSSGVIERRKRQTINLTWHDPLAQSFLVDSVGGAFLESIDLYVKTKPVLGSFDDHPLDVSIVEMLNGYPTQNILRHSKVSLTSDLVNATDSSADTNSVQQGLTNFQFPNPVYVEEGKEYAVVVASQSAGYCVWVSVLGEQDVFEDGIAQGSGGGDNNAPDSTLPDIIRDGYNTPVWDANQGQFITRGEFDQIYSNSAPQNPNPGSGGTNGGTGGGIARQPYLGSLFLSQNSSTWTADQMKDLTFSIKQYQFRKDFESYYIAKDNKKDQNGDYTIYGDTQTFAFNDVVDNKTFILSRSLTGLTEADIKVTHSVDGVLDAFADPVQFVLDVEENTITLDQALTIGQTVEVTTRDTTFFRRNRNQGSTLFLNIGQYILPGTEIVSSYVNQKIDNPSLVAGNILTNDTVIPNRQNVLLDAELIIDDGVNGFSSSPAADTNNLWIQNKFFTTNANISPVIEKQAYRFVLIRNLAIPLNNLDNPDNASDWDAGKYVGKTVELLNEADDLRVIVDAYLPNNSDIEVYYRTIDSATSYVTVDRTSTNINNLEEYESLFGKKVALFDLTGGNLVQSSIDKAFVGGVSFRSNNSTTYSGSKDYLVGDTVIAANDVEYICIDNHVAGDDAPNVPSAKWQTYDNRVYLTNIGDVSSYESLTDGWLIDDLQLEDPSTPCTVWNDATNYTEDDYVIHNNKIFRKVEDGGVDTGTYPTVQGTAWELIPAIRVANPTGVLLDDAAGEWKPMKYADPTFDTGPAQSGFIEFTFIPEIDPATSFEDFAIKVDMKSITPAHVPIIKNLRAIAII